jgi:hypothetical protein
LYASLCIWGHQFNLFCDWSIVFWNFFPNGIFFFILLLNPFWFQTVQYSNVYTFKVYLKNWTLSHDHIIVLLSMFLLLFKFLYCCCSYLTIYCIISYDQFALVELITKHLHEICSTTQLFQGITWEYIRTYIQIVKHCNGYLSLKFRVFET